MMQAIERPLHLQASRALRFCSGDVQGAASFLLQQRQQASDRRAADRRKRAARIGLFSHRHSQLERRAASIRRVASAVMCCWQCFQQCTTLVSKKPISRVSETLCGGVQRSSH